MESGDDEIERMKNRIRRRQAEEFDTPWPVSGNDVCISFIHIPSLFDDDRSQRIFNLINKDVAFAPLVEHPVVLAMMDEALGRDAIVLDMSVNHIGPHTNSAGWHVDSPLTQIAEPLPNFTLGIQTAWMLDDFTVDNGATHVVTGSNHTQRKPPSGRTELENETVLEGPAGSIAMWLSQTWHRHGANVTDGVRNGVIVQYGRSWVKPFVDLRTPMDARASRSVLATASLHVGLQRQRTSARADEHALRQLRRFVRPARDGTRLLTTGSPKGVAHHYPLRPPRLHSPVHEAIARVRRHQCLDQADLLGFLALLAGATSNSTWSPSFSDL